MTIPCRILMIYPKFVPKVRLTSISRSRFAMESGPFLKSRPSSIPGFSESNDKGPPQLADSLHLNYLSNQL